MTYSSLQHRKKSSGAGCLALIVLAAVALVAGGFVFYEYQKTETVTCTVTSTDRTKNYNVNTNTNTSDARVYTKECGTMRVGDSFIKGKFKSGDTFGQIESGHTYRFTRYGFRFGPTSSFPNIIKVEEVN